MKTQSRSITGGVVSWIIFSLFVCGFAVVVLYPVFGRHRETCVPVSCQSNLKQIGLGYSMYEQDYGAWPVESGWIAELMPYTKNSQIYICPSELMTNPGYTMNMAVSGKRSKDLPNPADSLLTYEAKKGMLVFRHSEGCNNLFGDGHVMWLRPNDAEALLK